MNQINRYLKFFVSLFLTVSALGYKVEFEETDEKVELKNGFTFLSFNKKYGYIDKLSADFFGQGKFSSNILSKPFGLEVRTDITGLTKFQEQNLEIRWISQTEDLASFEVKSINQFSGKDSEPFISEDWVVSLNNKERSADILIKGKTLETQSKVEVYHALHGVYTPISSLYSLFDHGVAQMKDGGDICMGANEKPDRLYFMGEGLALDVIYSDKTKVYTLIIILLF